MMDMIELVRAVTSVSGLEPKAHPDELPRVYRAFADRYREDWPPSFLDSLRRFRRP